MIKVKAYSLREIVNALKELLRIWIPMRTKLRLHELVRDLEGKAGDFEKEQAALADRYALRDEKGEKVPQVKDGRVYYNLNPDMLDEAKAALEELNAIEVEVDESRRVRLSELGTLDEEGYLVGNGKRIDIDGDILFALGELFVDDHVDKPKAA